MFKSQGHNFQRRQEGWGLKSHRNSFTSCCCLRSCPCCRPCCHPYSRPLCPSCNCFSSCSCCCCCPTHCIPCFCSRYRPYCPPFLLSSLSFCFRSRSRPGCFSLFALVRPNHPPCYRHKLPFVILLQYRCVSFCPHPRHHHCRTGEDYCGFPLIPLSRSKVLLSGKILTVVISTALAVLFTLVYSVV